MSEPKPKYSREEILTILKLFRDQNSSFKGILYKDGLCDGANYAIKILEATE